MMWRWVLFYGFGFLLVGLAYAVARGKRDDEEEEQ